MKLSEVINAWIAGAYARTPNGSLSSDGRGNLRSYNLIIGTRDSKGQPVVGNFRSLNGGHYISQTTSTHVGMADAASGYNSVTVDTFQNVLRKRWDAGLVDLNPSYNVSYKSHSQPYSSPHWGGLNEYQAG